MSKEVGFCIRLDYTEGSSDPNLLNHTRSYCKAKLAVH